MQNLLLVILLELPVMLCHEFCGQNWFEVECRELMLKS